MYMTNNKNNIYIIRGGNGSIENFFKAVKILGKVKDIKIQKLEYRDCDILSELTTNQRKILNSAKKFGYYDYPRKITSEELSEKIGINKDIILESLRKAEKHIFTKIFNDNYPGGKKYVTQDKIRDLTGLGIVDFEICAHYSEAQHKHIFENYVEKNRNEIKFLHDNDFIVLDVS